MTLTLHAHPFSSYSWKAMIALYETGTPLESVLLDQTTFGAFKAMWPIGKFPLLVDDARGATIPEASIIIEYLDLYYPGVVRLLPEDPDVRLDVRLLDRFLDNYVSTRQQKIVADRMRGPDAHDPHGVADARAMLATAYRWLDDRMATRTWAVGDAFSLADCGAGPFLFYADWVQPIDASHPHLKAYLARLRERPSVKRAVDGARPYRHLFPGGVPSHAD
ncbi:glutathione S-transferase family protein [Methylobacterium gnaphalii]|uniref:Glutathione S-transferase n=1 Tax=Methylobacterium gnaphalii TaxID=1010610 RepID=A0A512JLR1_9HYPH|nr:glutathione S-transferase family protein [Methylobacterium gnaphalii]GEP10891.1 glutathione S-transferase [Methylobacterium gnaphalii]GJD68532.1 Glutathione S-transferase GstB [Methylobacterium gnaphalii]GLS50663.1 glutathione S-transferase [Methylobacterium gnaphalii]